MDDERLLAEALRAQAAGGVSTPGVPSDTARPAGPTTGAAPEAAGPSRLRDRFRPLARSRRQGDGDTPLPGGPAIPAEPATRRTPAPPTAPTSTGRGAPSVGAPPVPRPAPGTPERPWPQAGPRPPVRPVPGRPLPTGPVAHPGAAGVPHPRQHPTGATPAAPAPADPTAWTPARIAWWSGVALLAGAVAGALAAVGTLALPG
ncbi:hypothetical protein ACQPX6_28965 [Actinomycetospora sp. CA-101289]|uniref:hypothetical protein n=1 Tax=Actinomycetospora sp. CA-101289 TaxID=3239893 RepID=UPI003D95CA82